MKIKSLLLLNLVVVVMACNSNTTNSATYADSNAANVNKTDSANTSQPEAVNRNSIDNKTDTTIIPVDEYEKIRTSLVNSNIPKSDIAYINIALQKARRIDEIITTAGALNERRLEELKKTPEFTNAAKKFIADNKLKINPEQAIVSFPYEIKTIIDKGTAQTDIDLFNNADGMHPNSVRTGLDDGTSPSQNLKSISFDQNNEALANLVALYYQNLIDGFRVYLAKGQPKPASGSIEYKFIIVGNLKGEDQDITENINGHQISSLQDYGQPCKPSCGKSLFGH